MSVSLPQLLVGEKISWNGGPAQTSQIASWINGALFYGGYIGCFVVFYVLDLFLSSLASPYDYNQQTQYQTDAGLISPVLTIIICVAIYFRYKQSKNPANLQYIVTNKRAIISQPMGTMNQVLQSCDLINASVAVSNRRNIIFGRPGNQQGSFSSTGRMVGDVIFMVDAVPSLTFVDVGDPDGVQQIVERIIADIRSKLV